MSWKTFLGVLVFGLLASSVARADCCVNYETIDNSNNNRNQVISQLSEKINAMQLAILEGLRLGTGQLSGNLKEGVGASSNIANVQDDRSVVGHIESARMDTIKSAASGTSSCNVMTGVIAGGAVGQSATSLTAALNADAADWDLGSSDSMPSASGHDEAVAKRLTLHCKLYANADDVRSQLCSGSVGSTWTNADVNAAKSIFYQANNTDVMTLDSDHANAAKAFLINSIMPNPQSAMTAGSATTIAGRELAAARQAATARMSIASYVASDIVARRAATMTGDVVSWATDLGSKITGYNPSFSNGISWEDWMDVRAKGWYRNPDWQKTMDGGLYTQAIKDGVQIQAFQAYTTWELYKLVEKQNLLLAAMLSISTEANRNTSPTTASK